MFSRQDIRKILDTLSYNDPSSQDAPSLIRSYSGNNLVRRDIVTEKLRKLVIEETASIALSGLPIELGISNADLPLQDLRDETLLTSDGQAIVPEPMQAQILSNIKEDSEKRFIALQDYATKVSLNVPSLTRLIEQSMHHEAIISLEVRGRRILGSTSLVEHTCRTVSGSLAKADQNAMVADLTDVCPGVPVDVVESLARRQLDHDQVDGVIDASDGACRFVPVSSQTMAQKSQERAMEDTVAAIITRLEADGCCHPYQIMNQHQHSDQTSKLDMDEIVNRVQARLYDTMADFSPSQSVDSLSEQAMKQHALVTFSRLTERISEFKRRAEAAAFRAWETRTVGEEPALDVQTLVESSDWQALDQIILSDTHSTPILEAYAEQIELLQSKTAIALKEFVQQKLLAPIALYHNSMSYMTDQTLRDRVSEFAAQHLKADHLSPGLAQTKTDRLVPSKLALGDLERFSIALKDCSSLEDIVSAAKKFARRAKIEQPSTRLLQEVQLDVLGSKVTAMKKMKRASDLLQNLTWMLLAAFSANESDDQAHAAQHKIPSLFVSSGKDTSRIIKLLGQLSPDSEGFRRVEGFRDQIKQGTNTEEQTNQMRDMAEEALELMLKAQRS